jgi:SAM-dependent methyltransferase
MPVTLDAMRAHYRNLLAPVYGWMLGDPAAAYARSRVELESLGIGPARFGERGLDLGAGTGLQSIPLANLGYRVTAVDASPELLAELVSARPDVEVVNADLASYPAREGEHTVVVCMGDTLPHLASVADVERVLALAAQALAPGGKLCLTFRDYASSVREGADRFVLVRGDADRVLTCCLDYQSERVNVTDILHERRGGAWTMKASTYQKLRLSRDQIEGALATRGLEVTRADVTNGRVTLVARRPAK